MDREPAERILFQDHPCFRATPGRHLRGVVLAIALGVAAGLAQTIASGRAQTGWVAPAVAVVLLSRFGAAALRRHATRYTVTDRRVRVERGLLRRTVTESPLGLVVGVSCRQTLRERLLDVGTVALETPSGVVAFRHIGRPQSLARALEASVDEQVRV